MGKRKPKEEPKCLRCGRNEAVYEGFCEVCDEQIAQEREEEEAWG